MREVNRMVTVYMKPGKWRKIASKKPKTAVKIGETKHTIRYAQGKYDVLVPKKGSKIKWDK